MAADEGPGRLDRQVDPTVDHVLGPAEAPITLVEYGSYACPQCRAANERIAELRDEFGDRLRYVFRHRPLPNNDLARRAAELAERASGPEEFWDAHVALMTRSIALTEDDLRAVARDLGVDGEHMEGERPGDRILDPAATDAERPEAAGAARRARSRVDADEASADASGVRFTPTFFINGRRYEGLWEGAELTGAMLGSLGHRVRAAALDFARWAPSTGLLLLAATVLAVVWTNSRMGIAFAALWETELGFTLGDASFRMSLLRWVNDGLLTIFFLVVGLEIKREFTVGHLAGLRSAAFPVAAAVGGMAVPALLYSMVVTGDAWSRGWGVPMTTDTAFAVALIVMMGRRVPIELRIFLTAAAIVDDIGAITVVALFYSDDLRTGALLVAALISAVLATLNHLRVYRVAPYALLGVALWAAVHAGGLHATLAGVILALSIPTRQPPNLRTLMAQAESILIAEARHGGEVLRLGPSAHAMRALDRIHDRWESPADRMLRTVSARSSYVVLPLFALANAGVVISSDVVAGHLPLMLAVAAGLVVGKPVGVLAASALAVRLGIAVKPDAYSWTQVLGAGSLAGIGFTMSLFIASEAFPVASDFAAAKIAVFGASVVSAAVGVTVLYAHGRRARGR